VKLFV